MTGEQAIYIEPENYADENWWGLAGDVIEDFMDYDFLGVPGSVVIVVAAIYLLRLYIRRRWQKGGK